MHAAERSESMAAGPDRETRDDRALQFVDGSGVSLWKWWLLVVVLVSGPWFGVLRHPQWNRVTWIPFRGAEDKPRDVVANFLLWVPFGWSYAGSRRRRRSIAEAVRVGGAVSFTAEAAQLFFRSRDPSATDVLMAVCGIAVGALASQMFRSRRLRRSGSV